MTYYDYLTSFLNSNPLIGILIGAILGTLLGIPASFTISAIFADTFVFPSPFGKRQSFAVGIYKLYAPSREADRPIIQWKFVVEEKRPFLEPKITMSCVWATRGAVRRNYWEYKGYVTRVKDQIVFRLKVVKKKSDLITIDGEVLKNTMIDSDLTFILMHEETVTWVIRPCLIAGFDTHAQCYAGVGLIMPEDHNVSDKDLEELLSDDAFIGYKPVRARVEDHQFPGRL